ncbi:hemerythrin domain-containing protein [Desulfosarcina variabilis]|uniref:hemerythrin domain-containing protein n=1 Tax=Desulfosarcina variabilis TaxID=2300 RepID=UPI003AFAAC56
MIQSLKSNLYSQERLKFGMYSNDSKRRNAMNAINELLTEHEAVRTTLRIIETIGQDIERTGKISNPDHVEQLLEFFTTFVDRCHHGKEEELLFPALEKVGISREGGPVGVMLEEHQRGRNLVSKMKNEFARYRNGDGGATEKFKRHADDYIALLDFYIDKENKVLFPLAINHLPESDLSEMKHGFDQIESEKIGVGTHERFHQMLSELGNIYLQ